MVKPALVVGSLALVITAGCGQATPQPISPGADASTARATIESASCGPPVRLPDHCVWPEELRRTTLLSATRDVVVDVGIDGYAKSARIVHHEANPTVDEAFVACAMKGHYGPIASSAAGETCNVTVRLSRYASDLAPLQARMPSECTNRTPTQGMASDVACAPGSGWY